MKYKLLVRLLLVCAVATSAANLHAATVQGRIHGGENEPLLGANVLVVGTQRGASSDMDGNYVISDLLPGNYTLRVSLVGYSTEERAVTIAEDEELAVDFHLEVNPIFLEEMKISTEREVSGVDAEEPVRKEIIVAQELQEASTDGGLLTALSDYSGLTVRPCALCGSMGIGMQGLDPSYTDINVDGLPVLSGLGTLYSLDGISVADVSSVELVKGSGSNLFGAGAIAGGVNLVSTRTTDEPSLRVNLSSSDTRQYTMGLSGSHRLGGIPFRLSTTYSSEPDKVDRDSDGVTDTPEYKRLNVIGSLSKNIGSSEVRLGGRLYMERRFAGETRWTEDDRGSDEVYGRDIETDRKEVSFAYTTDPTNATRFSLNAAAVRHEQNSWYGTTQFDASQDLISVKTSIEEDWSPVHSTLFQGVYQHDDYKDNLALGAPTDRLNRVPGVIAQHTWKAGHGWVLLGGSRLEHFNDYGWVFNPRGSVLWRPDDAWGFRFSGGTGFRRVSIFSVDKAVHAGFDNVLIPDNLKPERSVAGSFSVNRQWLRRNYSVTADLNAFYTVFDNKVILAYDDHIGTTMYSNAQDAYSRGVELKLTWRDVRGWVLKLGGTRTEVQYMDAMGWHEVHLQNRYTGSSSLEKNWVSAGVSAEVSADLYGPQKLPEGRSRAMSLTYTLWNLRVSKEMGPFELSGSVKNLTDWTQPDNPYLYDAVMGRRLFDSSMLYGPLLGRTFHLSLSYALGND